MDRDSTSLEVDHGKRIILAGRSAMVVNQGLLAEPQKTRAAARG